MSFELVGVKLVADNGPDYFATMAKADKAVDQFGSTAGSSFKQMPGLSDIAVGALHKIGEAAVNLAMQGAQALGGFFKDSISEAGDFQQNFAEFGNAVGHTIDGTGLKLDDFKKEFISLGKELPVSTADVEKAAIEMARGGIDPAVIAGEGLRRTIQFASASMKGDLVQAAQISAKTMQAWTSITDSAATKTEFLSHAQDLMSQATTAASTTVDQLFLGLSNVGGTARLAGVSFDETVKALAQLTPSFASSADAGTSLKTFLSRLQPSTKPAIAAMESLGLWTEKAGSAFYDANGKFVGMAQAEALLQGATKDLTDAQRQAVLQQIFGNDAIRAAAVFAQQGAAGYNALSDSIAKQTTLTDAAANNQSTYNTAVENFHGSIEALQITIGTALLPVLTDLFNKYLAPGINTVTEFASSILSAENPIMALTGAIDSVLPGFQTFADWLGVVIPQAIQFLMDHLDAVEGVLIALGAVIAGAAVAGAIASLMNPITLIVGGIALLGAAWASNWGGIQDKTKAAWNYLQPVFADVATWLGETIPKAVQVVSDYWTTTLYPALQKVWNFIQANVVPILITLVNTYFKALETELVILAGFWSNVLWPALQKVWSFLSTYVIPLLSALTRVQIALLKVALIELTNVWNNNLLPAITAVYNWFNQNIVPIFDATKSKSGDLADTIRKTLGPAFDWLGSNVIQPIIGFFNDLGTKIQAVIDFVNHLADLINNLPSIPSLPGGGGSSSGASLVGGGRGLVSASASPAALMARASGTGSAVYNQQRTTNLTYHTQYAPPASQSLAMVSAMAGGSP